MKAIVSSAEGPVLNDAFENPVAGPGQVLVRIKAAALNRADLAMLTGAAHGFVGGMGMPLGLEWAGEVVAVGDGVDHLVQGDRVMGAGPGAFTEYTVANAKWVYPVPDSLPIEHAAALPVSLQTMHDAITSNGQLKDGQAVLIQGAASAMGLMGLQIARLMGAGKVIGTSTSAQRREQLASFGADVAVDTRSDDWVKQILKATKMKGVDLSVDLLAGPYVNGTVQATRIGGRLVNVGRMAGERTELDLDQHSMRRITYVGVTFRTRTPAEISEVIAKATVDLLPALADGRLRMPVDRVYRFDEVRAAFDHMAANRHFGKIVLAW
jgi:NADPH2:quinone reductase